MLIQKISRDICPENTDPDRWTSRLKSRGMRLRQSPSLLNLVSIHKWPFLPGSAFFAGFRLGPKDYFEIAA